MKKNYSNNNLHLAGARFLKHTLVVLLLCLMSFTKSLAATYFSGGSGTSGDPFQISTVADLNALADSVNNGNTYSGKYFILTNSLDLNVAPYNTGAGWTSIGGGQKGKSFAGNFNGNNKMIVNLYINNTAYNNLGLFGSLSSGAKVYNLGVEDAIVTSTTGYSTIGILAGYNGTGVSGQLSQCYTTGSISGGSNVGGLSGGNYGGSNVVINCYSQATVTGTTNVGGLMGYLQYSDCQYSYSSGKVTGTTSVSGFMGNNNGANAHGNCVYDSQVSGQSDNDTRGIPETTTAMGTQATFTGLVGILLMCG